MNIYVDAATQNNGKYGLQKTCIVGLTDGGYRLFVEHIGDKTNNEGELAAIHRALVGMPPGMLAHIHSDSKVAVGWVLKGKTKTGRHELDAMAYSCQKMLEKTGSTITWIPRHINLAGIYLENAGIEKHDHLDYL